MKQIKSLAFCLATSICLFSCASGLHYNATSAKTNVEIDSTVSGLITKSSTDGYNKDSAEINTLKAHIASVYQQEKKRGLNHATVAMWAEFQKPGIGYLYSYFDKWKSENILSQEFAQQFKQQPMRHLQSIIDLENHKKGGPQASTTTSGN